MRWCGSLDFYALDYVIPAKAGILCGFLHLIGMTTHNILLLIC